MRHFTALLAFLLASSVLAAGASATCPASFQSYAICPTHACIDCSGNSQVAYYYTHDPDTNTCHRGSPITRDCNVNPIRQDFSTSYTDKSCTWTSSVSATCTQGRSQFYPWPSDGYTTSSCIAYNVPLHCDPCYCGMGASSCAPMTCDTRGPNPVISGAPTTPWPNYADLWVAPNDDVAGCDTIYGVRLKSYTSDPGTCPAVTSDTGFYSYNIAYTVGAGRRVTQHEWYCAAAKDRLGKYGYTAAPTEFKVGTPPETVPPTVTVTGAPSDWSRDTATADITCDDGTGSGCKAGTFMLEIIDHDGTCPATHEGHASTPPRDITGYKKVCGTAQDNDGNTGFGEAVFKVDTESPSLGATSLSGQEGGTDSEENLWYSSSVTVTPSCSDNSGTCTITWCIDTDDSCDPQDRLMDGSFLVEETGHQGLAYARVKATDPAGNTAISSEPVRIDTTQPTLSLEVKDQDGNPLSTQHVPERVTSVTITATGSDGESGLEGIEFEYVHIGEGEIPEAQTKACGSSPCTLEHRLSGLMYTSTARDAAGNSYKLPAKGWYYAVHHPLVNFLAQDAFLELGNVYDADVMVRNMGDQADNVTVWIGSSYDRASFISGEGSYTLKQNDRLVVVEDLLPQESRVFTVRVLPKEKTRAYKLEINATSSVSSVTDGDQMTVLVSYPASFPGIGLWAAVLLVALSGAAYWRKL